MDGKHRPADPCQGSRTSALTNPPASGWPLDRETGHLKCQRIRRSQKAGPPTKALSYDGSGNVHLKTTHTYRGEIPARWPPGASGGTPAPAAFPLAAGT